MPKRRDENRQLRPEEVEALENNMSSEPQGTWAPVGKEELQKRKIVKVRRTSTGGQSAPSPFTFGAPASGSDNKPNPFAGLIPSSTPAPEKANPFASVLSAPASASKPAFPSFAPQSHSTALSDKKGSDPTLSSSSTSQFSSCTLTYYTYSKCLLLLLSSF